MRKFRRLLIVLVIGALIVWWFWPSGGPSVAPGSILVLTLEGEFVEAAEPPWLARLLGEERRSFVSLLMDLRKAERDDRLSAVVFRIRDLNVGWAQAQEIRQAISRLSAAGRKTVAYLELASLGANREYYVASAADEIVIAPGARAPVIGLAAEYLFLGGFWEMFGIDVEVERIGEYKSVAETIAGKTMSKEYREMAESLLDSIDAQFVAGIAEGRSLSEEYVRHAIDTAAMTPEEMLALNLIDGVRFEDEIFADLGGGPVIEGKVYSQVDPASAGLNPVAKFALIYGSGPVLTGEGASSRSGTPILASDTVSKAFEEAAKDPEISAIIFRIDSPGGSALASDAVWRATLLAKKHDKPLIVSFSDVAASGGYYVACGADAIVASPGSITGSIGVVVLRPVLQGLFEKLGIGVVSLRRGNHADLAFSTEPLTAASRGRLRAEVSSVYDLFVARVAAGRALSPERVNEIGRGRVWTGAQAAKRGLVDALGGLSVAEERAKLALGLDPAADVALVPYPPPPPWMEQLDEMFRWVAMSAAPTLPLPGLGKVAFEWLAAAPAGKPALLPPFVFGIH